MAQETAGPRLQHGQELLRNLSDHPSELFWRQLHEWGQDYVGSCFGHHLTKHDRERVAELAILDSLDAIFDPLLPFEAKLSELVRALECQRQRHRRYSAKHVSIDSNEEPERTLKGPDGRDEAAKFLQMEHLQAVRQRLFNALHRALPTLRDSDHDGVVLALGLDEVGITLRGSCLSERYSAENRRTEAIQKALQRAKRRLRSVCVELLCADLERASLPERDAIEGALKILNSGLLDLAVQLEKSPTT